MSGTDTAEFDEVTHGVLRNFLRGMGWNAGRYLVFPVTAAATPKSGADAVRKCNAIAARAGDSVRRKEFAEPLVRLAMLLDQGKCPAREMEAALPESLVKGDALACVMLARAYLRENRRDEAEALLYEGLIVDPGVGALHCELGLLLREQGNLKEAVVHLQASIELRSGFRFDHQVPLDVPVLVARPSEGVEIHYYRGRFYIHRLRPDLVRTARIAGEIFAIRSNRVSNALRRMIRQPLLRPVLLRLIGRTLSEEPKSVTAAASRPGDPVKPRTTPILQRLRFKLRTGAKAVAMRLFAVRLPQAGSMIEALAIARSLAAQHPEAPL